MTPSTIKLLVQENVAAQHSVQLTAFGAGGRDANPLQSSKIADESFATNSGG